VRGNGRAQATHLKTRGKSRYGSRLRLQNWRRLLSETNERLHDLWQQYGVPARVFWSAPVRVWADVLAADPLPPFVREGDELQRLPLQPKRLLHPPKKRWPPKPPSGLRSKRTRWSGSPLPVCWLRRMPKPSVLRNCARKILWSAAERPKPRLPIFEP